MDPDVPPSCIQLVADGVFFTVRDFMRKVVVAVWNEGAPLEAVDLDAASGGGSSSSTAQQPARQPAQCTASSTASLGLGIS